MSSFSPSKLGNDNLKGEGDGGENEDNESNNSSQTDLSDVGLCALNIHEFSYNAILCLL